MFQLPPHIKYVACYLRKSREDLEAEKRGEDTLLAQRDLIEKDVLPRYDLVDYKLYEEVVSGESIKDRPEFQRLLDDVKSGKFQAIVVKDLYRLGRGNYTDMGVVYDLIRDKRIFIITRDNVLDPSNHDDLRNIRFSMFLSREEYEAIVWRLVNGKYDKVRNRGSWVAGVSPFGYDYDRQTRKLVPNGDAETVRMIFDYFVNENMSYGVIGQKLKKMGILAPKKGAYWNPAQIKRILGNPAYIGTVRFRMTKIQKSDGKRVDRPIEDHIYYENAHEPIIDQETWKLAQNRLNIPRPKVNVDFSPCELASLIVCSDCGRKMVKQVSNQHYKHRNDDGVTIYKKSYLACLRCGHYVKYDVVEAQIIEYLKGLSELDGELLSDVIDKMKPQNDGNDFNNVLNLAKEKQNVLTNRLKNLKNKWLDGKVNDEEYEIDRKEIQDELGNVEESVQFILRNQGEGQLKNNDKNEIEKLDKLKSKIKSVIDVYFLLDNKSKKNELLLAIFDGIELVFLGKEGRFNRFELNLMLSAGFLDN